MPFRSRSGEAEASAAELVFQRRPSFQTPAEVYRIPLPPIFDGWHVRIGRAAAGRWRGGSLRGVQVRAVTGRGGSRQEGCSARLPAGMIASAHNSRCDKKSAHDSPHGSWQCIICARLSHGRCSTASSGAHLQQIQPFICRAMRVFCSSVNLLTRCEQQGPLLDSLRWTVRSAALPLLPAPPTAALGARCLTALRMGS